MTGCTSDNETSIPVGDTSVGIQNDSDDKNNSNLDVKEARNTMDDEDSSTAKTSRPESIVEMETKTPANRNTPSSFLPDKSVALNFGETADDDVAVNIDAESKDGLQGGSSDSIAAKSSKKRPLSNLLTDKLKKAVTHHGNTTHSAAGKEREKREARSLQLSQIYSWLLCLFVYPVLIGCLVLWYYLMTKAIGSVNELQVAYFVDITTGDGGELNTVFALGASAQVCTLVFIIGLGIFFFFFWDAPEVRSRHHGFVLHFCFGVVVTSVMGIAHSAVVLQRTNVDVISLQTGTTTPLYDNLDLWIRMALFFGIAMIYSAVVSRMRFMYMIFHRRSYRPNYWHGVLLHVLMFPVIFISESVCVYTDAECSTVQELAGAIFYGLFLLAEYFFYLMFTRRASSYFVDWQGNLRCFVVNLFGFWGPVLYAVTADESQRAQIAYLTWLVGPFMAWLFGIDNFLFVAIRVLSRRFTKHGLLNQLDLEGGFFRANEQTKDLVALLQNNEGRDLMLAYSHRRHCPEQLQFLIALHNINQGIAPARKTGTIFETENTHTERSTDENYHNTEEGVEAIAALYVRPESEREVNLPQILRDRLLKRIADKDYDDVIGLFEEAYNEISLMVSRNLLSDFMQTEEYKTFAEKRAEDDQLMEVFAKNNMVNRSQNISCLTDRDHTERANTERAGGD